MKLSEACCGDRIVIKDFLGDEEILKKISAMGLRKGAQFEVYLRCGRNILLRNHNCQFILSRDLADKIEVETLNRVQEPCKAPCLQEGEVLCEAISLPKRQRKRKRRGLAFFKKVCPFLSED